MREISGAARSGHGSVRGRTLRAFAKAKLRAPTRETGIEEEC